MRLWRTAGRERGRSDTARRDHKRRCSISGFILTYSQDSDPCREEARVKSQHGRDATTRFTLNMVSYKPSPQALNLLVDAQHQSKHTHSPMTHSNSSHTHTEPVVCSMLLHLGVILLQSQIKWNNALLGILWFSTAIIKPGINGSNVKNK